MSLKASAVSDSDPPQAEGREAVYSATIRKIVREYGQVMTYVLDRPEGFGYRAGEHVHLIAPGESISRTFVRHMSFASAPKENALVFSLDLSSGSPYKQRFSGLKTGDTLQFFGVTGAYGNDSLEPGDRVLYVAGGLGITAIRSLIVNRPDLDWKLVYSGRNYLFRNLPGTGDSKDRIELVRRQTLLAALDRHLEGRSRFFLCGPEGFVHRVSGHLQSCGVSPELIEIENFDR